MADTQKKTILAALGTRETVNSVTAVIAVTDTADTTHQVAVVFDKAFKAAPDIIGAVTIDAGSAKGVASVEAVTTTGMTVNLYQALVGALATANHNVVVTYAGQKVS
jgi:hypothetical protein